MKYATVAEARGQSGLRLVLTAGLPGPWSESAKAIFRARDVPFLAVEQLAGEPNADLLAWTGMRNAPIAVIDNEPPVHGWLDLLMVAERLGSGPSLLPESSAERALALGLSCEICAPYGFGWQRRLLMFDQGYGPAALSSGPLHVQSMLQNYGYADAAVQAAEDRMVAILTTLTDQLRKQQAAGSRYFIGHQPSSIDFHWACFSQMIAPLPVEDQPAMPQWLIDKYSDIGPRVADALDPILITHRNMIYSELIGLPLEF